MLPSSSSPGCPALLVDPFRARFPWYGPHLQTIRNPLRPPPVLPGGPGLPLHLPLGDGDVLSARLDLPPQPDTGRPTLLLVHGLGGCETSPYMLAASAHFTTLGCQVVRLSLRGSGPSGASCRGWSHAGRFGDLEAICAQLPAGAAGLVVLGFSLGGNLVLNYAARGKLDPRLVAAISVSAPIDMLAASDLIHRPKNKLYHDYLLRALKAIYLNPHSSLTAVERQGVARARTLFAIDDLFTAPHHGFRGAPDYYRRVSALPWLEALPVPTLLIHAVDDPFISADAYRGLTSKGSLRLALAEGGGHLGFHDRQGLWHLRHAERFLDNLPHLA